MARLTALLAPVLALLATPALAINAVPVINVPAYLGTWYQIASDFATSTFESRYCVVAEYGLWENGTVSVHNLDRRNSVDGPVSSIYGWAAMTSNATDARQGELSVHLQGVPVAAPYWIVNIGPILHDQKYEWAIVSDPLEVSLFVLARNVTRYYENGYNETINAILDNEGFNNGVNRPVYTIQDGCQPY